MGEETLKKMEEIVSKLQSSVLSVSELRKIESPPLEAIIGKLEKHEQNWRDLVAQQRKYLDLSKSDRQTTKAERDNARTDREATKAELDKAREDRKQAAELLDQAQRLAVSLQTLHLTYLLMGISNRTSPT